MYSFPDDKVDCHLVSLDDSRATKNLLAKPFGTRKRANPKRRRFDFLEKHLKTIRVTNWKILNKSRMTWNAIQRNTRAHPEMSPTEDEEFIIL
ncbi:hypothetical protein TNIN_284181 [Trichonephila inaurata madagascariensis]|uniref:Uncharacterized protein n=1 Tax=Trichonephila inaurata madagascariensis TaxID=2747483 RepID=A0A8X6MIY0_9ARAC|nr:hypothetical protein TNIN_284181 [Trichonephila inaurata madagascariensis]